MKFIKPSTPVKKIHKQSGGDIVLAKNPKPELPEYYRNKCAEPQPLVAMDGREFTRMPIPKSVPLLGNWLMEQSLIMIHAGRGYGKTYLALWIACAIAAGLDLFNWKCKEAKKVIYLDGEMASKTLQSRIRAINKTMKPAYGMFKLVTPDFQQGVLPDLSTREGQAMINNAIDPDTNLIIVDNLSCWSKSGREDSETWAPIAEWALHHRAEGRSVIFIHHSGKAGTQRGTSRREDLLDVVLALKKSPDSSPSDGACFEIIFEKNRHLVGDDVAPIKVQLVENEEGVQQWSWEIVSDLSKERLGQIIELTEQGLNQSEIAKKLGINRSSVSRALKKRKH